MTHPDTSGDDPGPTLEIIPVDESDPAALFCQYPGQHHPQPTHLELHLQRGTLSADYNAEPGPPYGMPAGVWHRRTLWLSIPVLTAAAANEVMAAIAPQARALLATAEIVWDGNNNVGRCDGDAEADLLGALDEALAAAARVEPVTAADYFAGDAGPDLTGAEIGLTADTPDEQLQDVINALAALVEPVEPDAVVHLVDGEEFVRSVREELRNAVRRDLDGYVRQIQDLRLLRDGAIRRLRSWGDSQRAIAALADMSHTQVQRITAGEEGP